MIIVKPSGNSDDDGSVFFDLRGEIFEKFKNYFFAELFFAF